MPTSTVGTSVGKPAAANNRRRGLTLVELLVVMAVIVLIAGLVVPSFAGLVANSRLRAGARNLLAQCRLARELAITRSTYCRLVVDDKTNGYSLVLYVKDDGSGQAGWQASSGSLTGPRQLPEGISFHRVISSDPGGEPQVTFTPDGRAQDFYLTLRDSHERRLGVKVVGTTGMSSIISPEDGDDFTRMDDMADRS